jgi:hypothetical protein
MRSFPPGNVYLYPHTCPGRTRASGPGSKAGNVPGKFGPSTLTSPIIYYTLKIYNVNMEKRFFCNEKLGRVRMV